MTFNGFTPPTRNYFPMPNEWVDICAEISNLAEIKVIQYVLRHTWGYREFGIKKVITTDEFMHGRKRADGSRMDKGTGLSNRSVIDGLRAAVEHGYLEYELDETDKARKAKSYALKMQSDVNLLHIEIAESDMKNVHSGYEEPTHHREDTSYQREVSSHRSEKDTLETHLEKDTLETQESANALLAQHHKLEEKVLDLKERITDKHKVVRVSDSHKDIRNAQQAPDAEPLPLAVVSARDSGRQGDASVQATSSRVSGVPGQDGATSATPPRSGSRRQGQKEPEITPAMQFVIDNWQRAMNKQFPLTDNLLKGASLLAPFAPTPEQLKECRGYCFKSNPEWFRDKRAGGVTLLDVAKNWESWQSSLEVEQEPTQTKSKPAIDVAAFRAARHATGGVK
jgi:hypothetical protein